MQEPVSPAHDDMRREEAGASSVRCESVLVLVNEKAGGVTAQDRARLLEQLAARGVRRLELAKTDELGPETFRESRDFDVFVVLGGDGTARAAARHAPADAPPLILLPGGTLNMLPRALYGDRPWPQALDAALAQGQVRRLSLGRANGEPFFVAALFGAPTLLARVREAAREGQYVRAVRRMRHFTNRAFSVRLRVRPGGERMRTADAVGVLCPSFSGGVEGDHLEWVRLETQNMMELLRVGLRAFGEGWRTDPAVDLRACRQGDIVSLGLIPATLDGEPRTFVSRVRITFEREGPRVIAVEREREEEGV